MCPSALCSLYIAICSLRCVEVNIYVGGIASRCAGRVTVCTGLRSSAPAVQELAIHSQLTHVRTHVGSLLPLLSHQAQASPRRSHAQHAHVHRARQPAACNLPPHAGCSWFPQRLIHDGTHALPAHFFFALSCTPSTRDSFDSTAGAGMALPFSYSCMHEQPSVVSFQPPLRACMQLSRPQMPPIGDAAMQCPGRVKNMRAACAAKCSHLDDIGLLVDQLPQLGLR